MSYMRTLARNVASTQMHKMGAHVNSKKGGKSPFSEHWREFAPGKFRRTAENEKNE